MNPSRRRSGSRQSLVLLLSTVALAGCSTVRYAEQAPQSVAVPDAWLPVAADMLEPLDACRILHGSQAAAVLAQVAVANADLLAATARLRQAEAAARAAGASLYPRLDAQLNGSRGTGVFASSVGTGAPEAITIYQGAVAASYELDVWGRLRGERAAAALDAGSAQAALAAVSLTLNAQAADTWIALIAQRRLVALLAEQRATSEKFLELTRLRFRMGQAPAQDIGRQRQQMLAIAGQQELAVAGEQVLQTQLQLLTGEAPSPSKAFAPQSFPTLIALPDPGLPASLASRRPDVQAAYLALRAADERTAAAVAARLPSLKLNASLLSLEGSLADLFSDTLWSVGATLAQVLFDGGNLRARTEMAEAGAETALWEYVSTLLAALQEVNTALLNAASQDRFAANLDEQLTEAERVLTLTRDGYRQGQASYLDVLNALLSRQGLERERVAAARQQYGQRIALCRALGQPVAADDTQAVATLTQAPGLQEEDR